MNLRKQASELKTEALFIRKLLTGREPWPGVYEPLNGQRVRLRAIRGLIERFEPDGFVETGTFIGSTTRFFAGNGVPVYTAEVKRAFWLLSRLRLGWSSDAHLFRGDSRAMLKDLVANRPFNRPFAYLDAHWWSDLPVVTEMGMICDTWEEAIMIIDDFRVDGDAGYAYDKYENASLSLEDIPLPTDVLAAFPAVPSSDETGARRGTLYVAHGLEARRALDELIRRGDLRLASPPVDGAAG